MLTNNWRSDVWDKAIFQVRTGNDQQLDLECLGQVNIPGRLAMNKNWRSDVLNKAIFQVETVIDNRRLDV